MLFLTFVLLLCVPFLVSGQSRDSRAGVGPNELLTDIIVRDRKGQYIRDLKPDEVEIFEDGVKQVVTSVRLIEGGSENLDPKSHPTDAPVDPSRPVRLVTMIFDDLHGVSRKMAREAALEFIKTGLRPNTIVAVFVLTDHFYVIQGYTADREKLRLAIEGATGSIDAEYATISSKVVTEMDRLGKPGTNNSDGARLDSGIAQITVGTLRAVEASPIEAKKRSWVHTLLEVAREHRHLPGRKTVLYFGNGLEVSPSHTEAMRTALSEANLANVTVYPIDTRGISVDEQHEQRQMRIARAQGMGVSAGMMVDTSAKKGITADAYQLAQLGEGAFLGKKQGSPLELAVGTTGALIDESNDLRKPLRRVAEEMGSYYLVSYLPAKPELDGGFRKLSVKVARPDTKVLARSGYMAVPRIDGKPVLSFEIPLLADVQSGVARNEFPYKLWIERTGTGERAEHQLTITVPVSQFNFQADQAKKQYSLHFAVLALVLNEKGEIVTRTSQDYPMSGKLDRVDSLQKGNFDFVRSFTLSAGSYKLRTVVRDFNTGKVSIREKAILVPEFNPSLGTGSLVVIKRLEPATNGDGSKAQTASRVIPNLEGTINAANEKSVGFALTVFSSTKEPPSLDLEIARGKDVVSRSTLKLPEPDERGRIAYLVSFDSAAFESGAYHVKARVKQGAAQVEESTDFVIENPGFVKSSSQAVAQVENTRTETGTAGPAAEIAPPVISPVGISETARELTHPLKPEKSMGAAPMDIPSLLREVEANGVKIQRSLLDYTYHLRKVRHLLNLNGEPIKETFQDYEGYPIKGLHVLIKIADMGRKLSDSEIDRERKRAGEELGKIEPGPNGPSSFLTAAISGQGRTGTVGIQVDPAVFFQACEFSDSRIEMLGGRETIAFDFVPRQGARLQADTNYVSKLTGTIWIDSADKVLVRLEARAIAPGVGKDGKPLRTGPDPKLVYQQVLAPGGGWYPSVIRLNAGGDGTIFYGLNWDVVFEFKDFHRFASNGNDYQIKPTGKP